jgi:hypothetical protein
MVNMSASPEPDDESLQGWAVDDSDGDAAYVDKPTVRSQLSYAPVPKKYLTRDRSEEGAPPEKEERLGGKKMRTRRARHPEARQTPPRLSLSNPCLIFSRRNMPPRTAKMRILTKLRDLSLRSMRNVETNWRSSMRGMTL